MEDISVRELKERMDAGEKLRILDVREPHEWEQDHITEENWPMASVPPRINELDKDVELIIHCRSGGRSGQIAMYLKSQGFTKARNLIGGMLAWKAEINPDFDVQ